MILTWLIIIPLLGGLAAWSLARWQASWARWASLVFLFADLALVLMLWTMLPTGAQFSQGGSWFVALNRSWIPQLGITFHLALDGLSLIMVTLTVFLGIIAVLASWTEIRERAGFFHFNLMLALAGVLGVFLALDLFLFYFFWEVMLIPTYFLIALWGREERRSAAMKFFLFSQAGGLLMLLGILGLYFIHGQQTGIYTFDYLQLLGTPMTPAAAMWLLLCFLAAFAVKLPAVPLHTWQPAAYTQAPTAGSVLLAGILSKTGAYGLLRFLVPLFPEAAAQLAPLGMALGVIGILYGAVLAFAQTDLKRLVAYTSVSHMGFILLGVFAMNELAFQGVVMQMVSHGISIGALFVLAGALQERIHSHDLDRMGGFWSDMPRLGAAMLIFALASLGLPGLGNFIAEILVLLGSYRVNIPLTVLATAGIVLATVYSLWIIQRIFHGEKRQERTLEDLSGREMAMMAAMIAAIVWLGLSPQPLLNAAKPSLDTLQSRKEAVMVMPKERAAGSPPRDFRTRPPAAASASAKGSS